MVIWPVLAGSGKTADLVLACFGWFRSHRVKITTETMLDTMTKLNNFYPHKWRLWIRTMPDV